MSGIVIEVEERELSGKNESRRLRRAGLVPGVLYGSKKQVVQVTVNPRDLDRVLHSEAGENTLLRLRLKGKDAQRHVMIKDYQTDPITGRVVHADFIRIEMDEVIEVEVPVRAVGIAPGVKEQGGLLEIVHRELQVECLPGDIPENIDVDISNMHIGDHVRIADVKIDGNYKILDEPDTVVITLVAPKAEEEEATAETAEAVAEPELIGKAKKDEGAEEKPKPKGGD